MLSQSEDEQCSPPRGEGLPRRPGTKASASSARQQQKRTMPSARLSLQTPPPPPPPNQQPHTDNNNNHSHKSNNSRKMQLATSNSLHKHPQLNGFHKSSPRVPPPPPPPPHTQLDDDDDRQQQPSPPSLEMWSTLSAKIPLVVSNGKSGAMKAKRAPPTVDAMDIGPAQTLPAEAVIATTITSTSSAEQGPPKRKRQATGEAMAAAGSHLRGANLAILQVDDESLVRTAMKKMPVAEVPELLEELQRGLYRSGGHLQKYLRCLAILLEEKFTFLSMTNLTQYQALKQLLAARTTLLDGCLRLKGRLDLLLAHTTKPEQKQTRPSAKQTYESDSEEESEEDEEEEDEEEEEDDDFRMKGGDDDLEGILDEEGMDEEMFGSDEEGDEEEEEEDIEDDAAVMGDDDSAAEADNDDDDDDDDDELEEDDDDDDD